MKDYKIAYLLISFYIRMKFFWRILLNNDKEKIIKNGLGPSKNNGRRQLMEINQIKIWLYTKVKRYLYLTIFISRECKLKIYKKSIGTVFRDYHIIKNYFKSN